MVRMKILFGKWDATHDGKQWATDILQTVVKEKPSMKNALILAFEDEVDKENLLTYVCLHFYYTRHPLTMSPDSVWQRVFAEHLHWQSASARGDQLWSGGKENRHRRASGMAAEQDSVRVWGY
jgi:hypothetical protein